MPACTGRLFYLLQYQEYGVKTIYRFYKYGLGFPYLKHLGPDMLWILEHLHMRHPSLSTKCICFRYTFVHIA